MKSHHSIRRTLLVRLVAPLLALTLLAGSAAYALAQHFSDSVLDQWLYDTAISLVNRVRWENGRASVDLSEAARSILEWDTVDHVFYEVRTSADRQILGNTILPDPEATALKAGTHIYYEASVNGEPVRLVAVSISRPGAETVIVKVAETQRKRLILSHQVLWLSVALSLLLATASAMLTWYGVGRGIASLQSAIYDVRTLHARAPLTPIPMDNDLPQEVFPLVEEINNLILDLSTAHRLNQRFIADAAHQLRTPLATLRVQLELALREQDVERHTRAINDAVEVLSRMGRVLHQLLTLAKADEDYAKADAHQSVDIDQIAREEIERRLDDAVAAGIDLGYEGPDQPVQVSGDAALLGEAVANLLDNALRYGAAGKHITVGVKSAPAPEIYVEDRGPGIPDAEQSKVRDRFYRIPASPGDGCGLGLSIVEEIARHHAATLILHNRDGSSPGLRARLVFPNSVA